MRSQSTGLSEKKYYKQSIRSLKNDWHNLEPSLSLLSCLLNASHSPSHPTYNVQNLAETHQLVLSIQHVTARYHHFHVQWAAAFKHSVARHLGTTSGTQISISPDSILSTEASIPYNISDHICGQNLDITTDK